MYVAEKFRERLMADSGVMFSVRSIGSSFYVDWRGQDWNDRRKLTQLTNGPFQSIFEAASWGQRHV